MLCGVLSCLRGFTYLTRACAFRYISSRMSERVLAQRLAAEAEAEAEAGPVAADTAETPPSTADTDPFWFADIVLPRIYRGQHDTSAYTGYSVRG